MRIENAPASLDDVGAFLSQPGLLLRPGEFDASEGDDIGLWGYLGWEWRRAETRVVLELGGSEFSILGCLAGYNLAYSMGALASALDGLTEQWLVDCPPWVFTVESVRGDTATLSCGEDAAGGRTVWTCPTAQLLSEMHAYVTWCLPFLDASLALAPSRGLALHRLHFVTYRDWLDAARGVIDAQGAQV